MCRNKAFSTPLHKACECSCIPVIEYLLSTGRVDPVARDMLLRQPLVLVKDRKDEVQRVFAKFSRMKTTHPVSSYVKIVLLGNPGAGKTSLAQVIIQRSTSHLFTSARRLFQEVKAVEPCTAGIIPSKLEHKELGDIILHDLAGQPEYYSSHIAVLEDLLHSSPAVFMVVVNLSDGDAVFKHFHQWLNVVENESQKASANSHIIIVASHIDKINQKDLLPYFSSKLNAILLTRFHHHSISIGGLVALDCRKTAGIGLSLLVKKLASACESVCSINTTEANLLCRMLYTLLTDRRDTSYRLDKLMTISEAAEGYFLPQKREELIEALSTLHSFGLITFLKNVEVPDYSWIIVQRAILLTEVNGVLFAPNDVQQHCNVASNTGIITQSALSQLFPRYASKMLVDFLQFMKLCQEIDNNLLKSTNLLTKDRQTSPEDKLLFFPALVRNKGKPHLVNQKFSFGWCLQCTNPRQFFLPRFLHLLVLQLAYQFALPKTADNPLHRRCTIWTNGIIWADDDGVHTLVELVDNSQCVLLLMSCKDGLECNMRTLCKTLIKDILSLQEEKCPSLDLQEFVIDPSELSYPIDKPSTVTLYDIEHVALCVVKEKPCVVPYNKHSTGILLSELFPYEIYMNQLSVFAGRNPEELSKSLNQDQILRNTSQVSLEDLELQSTSTCTSGNTASKIETKSNPFDILKRHTSEILDAISDPIKLANDLSSVDLLTHQVKDDVLTTPESRYLKASKLVNEIQRCIKVYNDEQKLTSFCIILKKQKGNWALSRISDEMMKELNR